MAYTGVYLWDILRKIVWDIAWSIVCDILEDVLKALQEEEFLTVQSAW